MDCLACTTCQAERILVFIGYSQYGCVSSGILFITFDNHMQHIMHNFELQYK